MESILIAFILLLFIGFSAFISGSEVAFFSLTKKELEMLENAGNKGKNIFKLLQKPRTLLGTILIANNTINITIVILSTILTNTLLGDGVSKLLKFLIDGISVTVILIIFGELLPKIYANQHRVKFSKIMIYPLLFLMKIFYPFTKILVNSTSFIEKKFKKKEIENLSTAELKKAIEITSTEKEQDTDILKRIMDFSNVTVKQIMTPRMDCEAYDYNFSFSQIKTSLKEKYYSRIPVFKNDFDDIKGILYLKDLLVHINKEDDFHWQKLLKTPFFVPENKKIDNLLRVFQEKKIHLAIVVDEYGGTSGIVTLEDILEEIVGEINDEFDQDELVMKKVGNKYTFDAKTSLIDFIRKLNLSETFFDDISEDAETIGGTIIELLGEIPTQKQKLNYKNLEFVINEADKKRIKQIEVTIK